MSSHFRGPLLSAPSAGGGAFDGADARIANLAGDDLTGPFSEGRRFFYDDFEHNVATTKWTVTTKGAVAANTNVVDSSYLVLNPGTAANTALELTLGATATQPSIFVVVDGVTDVTFYSRFYVSGAPADGGIFVGLSTSADIIVETTRALEATPNKIGFHTDDSATVFAARGGGGVAVTRTSLGFTLVDSTPVEAAIRLHLVCASSTAGTGSFVEYYLNNKLYLREAFATGTYLALGPAATVANGAGLIDLLIDSVAYSTPRSQV